MCMPRYVSSTFAVSSSRLQKCLKIFDDLELSRTMAQSLRFPQMHTSPKATCPIVCSATFHILPHPSSSSASLHHL